MALGDALAMALLDRRGFSHDDFAALHPGGRLGKKLLRVRDLDACGRRAAARLSGGENAGRDLRDQQKGLGMTTVPDADGRLAGIVTDGDLRRLMQKRSGETLELTAGEVHDARSGDHWAAANWRVRRCSLMEQRKITCVVVVDAERRVSGVVHLHDLWTLELF